MKSLFATTLYSGYFTINSRNTNLTENKAFVDHNIKKDYNKV